MNSFFCIGNSKNYITFIGGFLMSRKIRRLTFNELVQNNKTELLQDQEAMNKLEMRLEEKHMKKA
jgi:hypothetical protein